MHRFTSIFRYLLAFRRRDDGAITADWVVLTASIIIVVLSGIGLMRSEIIGSIENLFDWVGTAGT